MEKTNVPYEEWPEWIKVITAFYSKRIMSMLKTPKKARNMSYLSFTVGILVIAEAYLLEGLSEAPLGQRMKCILIFGGILNLLIGLFNWVYNYKMHLWVHENSSWEERYTNKSSGKHQLQYVLFFTGITIISWVLACLFCC